MVARRSKTRMGFTAYREQSDERSLHRYGREPLGGMPPKAFLKPVGNKEGPPTSGPDSMEANRAQLSGGTPPFGSFTYKITQSALHHMHSA